MTVEQYLHSSFEVEPDYLDGELVERHVGSLPRAAAKGRMLELLCGLPWHVCMSITMVMSPTRCRVADLAAWVEEPDKDYPDAPGELAIEILDSLLDRIILLGKPHQLRWSARAPRPRSL